MLFLYTKHLSFKCQFLAIYCSTFDRVKVNKGELIQHTSESKFKKLMILAKLSVKVSKYRTCAIIGRGLYILNPIFELFSRLFF